MSETKKSTFLISNAMFMILAFTFIIGSLIMVYFKVNFRLSIIIIQYVIIFLPILIVMKVKGVDIKKQFKFNSISIVTAFKVALITLAAIPIAYTLNFLMNYILIKMDLFQVQSMDFGDTSGPVNFIVISFLIALTPGFCEEFFFRGMMFSSYEQKMSPLKSMVITGLLFGLFHFNLQNLMLPAFLGIILAWLVYITNSIYSSILAHSLFNFIGGLFMMLNESNASAEDLDSALIVLEEQGGAVLVAMLVFSLFAGAALFGLMYWLKRDYLDAKAEDTIVFKDKEMIISNIDEDQITVIHEDEERMIKMKTLKKVPYKIRKRERVYEDFSKTNYFFVSMVIILYIGFVIFSYT